MSSQVTVRDWTAGAGGSALRDSGGVVLLPPDCLQDSVFRFLRPGQRVNVDLEGDVVVTVRLP